MEKTLTLKDGLDLLRKKDLEEVEERHGMVNYVHGSTDLLFIYCTVSETLELKYLRDGQSVYSSLFFEKQLKQAKLKKFKNQF